MKDFPLKMIFILAVFSGSINTFLRDFVNNQRYSNMGEWISDLIPATLGLSIRIVFITVVASIICLPFHIIIRKIKKNKLKEPEGSVITDKERG